VRQATHVRTVVPHDVEHEFRPEAGRREQRNDAHHDFEELSRAETLDHPVVDRPLTGSTGPPDQVLREQLSRAMNDLRVREDRIEHTVLIDSSERAGKGDGG